MGTSQWNYKPVHVDEESEHYKAALEPLSSNVAEIEAIVSVLLQVACEKELPDNLRFTVMEDTWNMFFGVIRPGWDVEGGGEAPLDGHCFYSISDGKRSGRPPIEWEGVHPAKEGDRINIRSTSTRAA